MVKAKTEVKEFLFNDHNSYNHIKKKEDNLFQIFNDLKELSVKALGNYEVDFTEYLKDPVEYLVNNYWTLYANMPDHLQVNKKSILESQTNIKLQQLVGLHKRFLELLKVMTTYKPTISKSGVKSTLVQQHFDRFLDPKKAEKYHILKRLVDATNDLRKFDNIYDVHLVRCCTNLELNDNGYAIINLYDFV